MRQRASELATEWLGRRSEREIAAGLEREVRQDRWTELDRALAASVRDGVVNLRDVPGDLGRRKRRSVLIGRLDYLVALGLAEKRRGAIWALHPEAERTLRTMGERGDRVRTMQRNLDRAL